MASVSKSAYLARGLSHIGLFDILRFKKLVETTALADIERLIGPDSQMSRGINMAAMVGGAQHWVSKFKPAPCHVVRFSDTILLVSSGRNERSFVSIVTASVGLMASAALNGIPLRGAITCGEVMITADKSFYAGKGLVRAHTLEQDQEWIGAVIDPESVKLDRYQHMTSEIARELWTVEYDVPTKKSGTFHYPCINWIPIYETSGRNLKRDLTRKSKPSSPSEVAKLEATLRFARWSSERWSRIRLERQGHPS